MPLSYITLTALQRIAHELAVVAGGTIVNLGCGSGGPGLWVARATGVVLVGIVETLWYLSDGTKGWRTMKITVLVLLPLLLLVAPVA